MGSSYSLLQHKPHLYHLGLIDAQVQLRFCKTACCYGLESLRYVDARRADELNEQ